MMRIPVVDDKELDALVKRLRFCSENAQLEFNERYPVGTVLKAADAIQSLRARVADTEAILESLQNRFEEATGQTVAAWEECDALRQQVAELRSAMAWESVDAVIAERDAAVKLRDEWCAEYTKARDELTASRERVKILESAIKASVGAPLHQLTAIICNHCGADRLKESCMAHDPAFCVFVGKADLAPASDAKEDK